MIKEFAVDPSYFSSRLEWQLIFQHFGFHTGRVISKFPQDWKKIAYLTLVENYKKNKIKEMERKALEEKLNNLEEHFVNINRPFESNHSWFENAIREDTRFPFHAIISKINPTNNFKILKSEQLDRENQYWDVHCQIYSQRTAKDISNCIKPLFDYSDEVFFVDPHFDPTEERYRNTLSEFLRLISNNKKTKKLEYHLLEDPRVDKTGFANSCKYYIKPMLRNNLHIKLVRWQKFGVQDPDAGGRRMHPRFILTEKGGVLIEWGLDEGVEGDEVNIFLLEPHIYIKQKSMIDKNKSAYKLIDEIII